MKIRACRHDKNGLQKLYHSRFGDLPEIMQGALFPFNPQIFPLLSMFWEQHLLFLPGLSSQPGPPQLPQLFSQQIVSPNAIPSYSLHGSKISIKVISKISFYPKSLYFSIF